MNANELKTQKKVFPFVCAAKECPHEYGLVGFTNVVMLWGFIYLTNGHHTLIGITCPDCSQTTVRKYPAATGDFSIEALEEQGIMTVNEVAMKPNIKHFVPFSPRILADLSSVKVSDTQQGENEEPPYKIPFGFSPIRSDYPVFISEEFPYSIDETSIGALLKIENEEKYKVFPRVVPLRSIYLQLDELLRGSDLSYHDINETLAAVVKPNDLKVDGSTAEGREAHYEHMIRNDLTPDEYGSMDLSLLAWEEDVFKERVGELLAEYRILRNRIDFELIYRNEFVNKYARLFYYKPGWRAQAQMEAEDDQHPPEGIQETVLSEFLEQLRQLDPSLRNEMQQPSPSLTQDGQAKARVSQDVEESIPSLKDKRNAFVRMGANWVVKFKGKTTILRDLMKVRYIVYLLENPNKKLSHLELVAAARGDGFKFGGTKAEEIHTIEQKESDMEPGDEGANLSVQSVEETFSGEGVLTKREIGAIRKSGTKILKELEEAKKTDDEDRVQNLLEEFSRFRGILYQERGLKISRIGKTGIGIKPMHQLSDEARRAWKNVGNQITNALNDIHTELPELERHLIQCIDKKMRWAVYEPERSKTDKSVRWFIAW